jgi:hypothetical protein
MSMVYSLTLHCQQNLGIRENIPGLRGGSQGTGPILCTARPVCERSADKYATIYQDVPNAHLNTRINGLHKHLWCHISMIRKFRRDRSIGVIPGPIVGKGALRVFDEVSECSLKAVREHDFVGGSCRSVECSKDNTHYEMIKMP